MRVGYLSDLKDPDPVTYRTDERVKQICEDALRRMATDVGFEVERVPQLERLLQDTQAHAVMH